MKKIYTFNGHQYNNLLEIKEQISYMPLIEIALEMTEKNQDKKINKLLFSEFNIRIKKYAR